MWDEEQDFEIIDEVEEYDFNDESTNDFPYADLDLSDDEAENSDVFEYEANFHYDEEDEH
jgi:hypothetical protein